MKKLSYIITSMLLCTVSYAQHNEQPKESKLRSSVQLRVGSSTFATDLAAPSNFSALEVRGGLGVLKTLTEVLKMRAGLLVGAKFKRKSLNQSEEAFLIGAPFLEVDKVASSRNHYFYEAPVFIQGNIKHLNIDLKAGIIFRHFLPNNKDVDFLTARREFGLSGGGAYRLSDRISIGVDYYYGLTKVLSSYGEVDGTAYRLDLRNQRVEFTIDYFLRKQSRRD